MSKVAVHALIPAAGSGERFGEQVPKQYQLLEGKAVLARSIEVLLRHPLVDDVTVILSADDQHFKSLAVGLSASVHTAIGGQTRAQSVLNGLLQLSDQHPDTDWVLVHDAARPCLPPQCLDSLLNAGMQSTDGAILALPVSDTLKRSNQEHEITGTVAREQLWAAQTPQMFRLGALRSAMEAAMHSGHPLTDEASALEHVGGKPKLVMGSSENIKITWPADLEVASGLVARSDTGPETGVTAK